VIYRREKRGAIYDQQPAEIGWIFGIDAAPTPGREAFPSPHDKDTTESLKES